MRNTLKDKSNISGDRVNQVNKVSFVLEFLGYTANQTQTHLLAAGQTSLAEAGADLQTARLITSCKTVFIGPHVTYEHIKRTGSVLIRRIWRVTLDMQLRIYRCGLHNTSGGIYIEQSNVAVFNTQSGPKSIQSHLINIKGGIGLCQIVGRLDWLPQSKEEMLRFRFSGRFGVTAALQSSSIRRASNGFAKWQKKSRDTVAGFTLQFFTK